ncbi:MAG: SpoIIE family protein phosphatase, partial [Bacteroidia bacterium]|nr:SpoIIE family protein phosphatase [Bacteroidia bacterium]
DTEKKEQEIALLNKDKLMNQAVIEKQATQKNALTIGGLLVLIIAVISVFAFISNKKKSNLLSKQVHEINYQNAIIKEKNKDITDSIVYAKRLQEAVFPLTNELNNYFCESFVLFRPKDIVSGDFYWFEETNNLTYLIVGDSTGHGVPGAFMSILGHNLLNQIILEEKISSPAEILSTLDNRVTKSLNKKGSKEEYNDGMDIGVCVIDKKSKKLYYSGANRPLIIKRGNEIFELKQNKFAIGGINTKDTKIFTQHEMDYFENDIFYLFSDGYYDQFGGPKGKKFKFKQLQEVLLTNANKSMEDQQKILNETFDAWKGNLEQVDDVCIIGIRL